MTETLVFDFPLIGCEGLEVILVKVSLCYTHSRIRRQAFLHAFHDVVTFTLLRAALASTRPLSESSVFSVCSRL